MSISAKQAARSLVEAFGRPDDIIALLAEDAQWWVSPSAPTEVMKNVSVGHEEILGNMRRVFGGLYKPETVRAEVHDNIGEGDLGVVRITLFAEFPNGGSYENDYTVWTKVRDGKITHVWEFVDVLRAVTQMNAAGIEFAPAS